LEFGPLVTLQQHQCGCYDVLKLLDKNINTDVNKCSNDGQSPLYIACQEGHDKIVKILLTHGADINKSRDNGYSPLQIACHSNHIDVVVELLKVQNPKVDIDICDNSFSTMSKCPFWQPIYKGDTPLSPHLFTSVLIFLSNSFTTMSKCPSWQATYKGDI
jgi:ankyrin repeat protein